MAFSPNAETVYADGPFGSPLQPSKPEIRSLLAQYEAAIDAYSSGAGSIAKSTRALLFADLAHAADVTAWVYADSTVAYNGIYRKSGASGAGSWSLILPLPFSFIIASDVGAGTPNAIQATTSIPVSGSALVWMNIFEANTASPVTVSFNGGAALTIKTNSGNDIVAGGLTAAMIVLGIVSGSTFRLVSDQASGAIVAAAEAAANAAATSETNAAASAAAAAASANNQMVFDTTASASAATIPATVKAVRLNGDSAYGDGHDRLYKRVTSEPSSPLKFRSTDRFLPDGTTDATNGGWWQAVTAGRVIGDILRYEDFGGFPTLEIDTRLIMRKDVPTLTDVYNVGIIRSTGALTGGTSGFVNSAFKVETSVDGAVSSYEWNAVFKLSINAVSSGEHCAAYSQLFKNANSKGWAHCLEARDFTTNPTTGTLGLEVGMFVEGLDPNSARHAIDISIGSSNSTTGNHTVTTGLRIGPTSGNNALSILTRGIQVKGRVGTGLDLKDMDVTYSNEMVSLPQQGKFSWKNGAGAEQAALAWHNTLTTWQITGVKAATSATAGAASALPAAPNRYLEMQVNGDLLRIPAYGA